MTSWGFRSMPVKVAVLIPMHYSNRHLISSASGASTFRLALLPYAPDETVNFAMLRPPQGPGTIAELFRIAPQGSANSKNDPRLDLLSANG